jgi:outer membrane protein OmpA-like peptidoglycan-associated protein
MRIIFIVLALMSLFFLVGCSFQLSYFGVENRAIIAPLAFSQTEAAIENAELSPGAQYCPEKIAQAKELGKKGVAAYWTFRDEKEAFALLTQARNLAKEAELCRPQVIVPPPTPAPLVPEPPLVLVVPEPPPVPVIPEPPPLRIIIFRGVNFAFDSYELTPRAQAILKKELSILQEVPNAKFEIAGHTDSIGSDAYNTVLSEKRGGSVRHYLVSKGIAKSRIKVKGYGESMPIATNDTPEGQAQNRRVEMKIMR